MRPLTLLAAAALAGCSTAPKADLVVYGRVWTGDSTRPWAGAVALRGDTILVVGDSAEAAPLVGAKTRVIAAGQGLVAPGLMHGHVPPLPGRHPLAHGELRGD